MGVVVAMSLSPAEQHALDSIEGGLAGTDPKLARLLAAFTRLAAGEEMPASERIHPPRRRWGGRPGGTGGTGPHTRWESLALAVWLTTAIALIAVGVLLSRTAGTRACSVSAVACIWQAPVRSVGAAVRSLELQR